jgi:Glycosyl transferase family 4
MSALPPKTDIRAQSRNVRFVPKADCRLLRLYVDLLLNNNRLGERKCGALARLRPNPNPSAVHLNDALRYGKPQAGLGLDDRCRGSRNHRRLAAIGLLGYIPWQYTVISLALCGATIGFAFFNRLVAKLFLGDVGSLPIGLLLGWLLLLLAGSSGRIAAILLPLYYLADSAVTLQNRCPAKPIMLTATRGKIHNFLFSPLPPEPDLRRHDPDGSPNMADLHFKVNHSRRLFLRRITSLAVDFLKPENLFTVLLVTVFSIL